MGELTRRYIVMQMATEGPFDIRDADAPFVLKPWKDPAALQALRAYRDHCYEELAQEIDQWIRAIASGPQLRGGVGTRNEQAVAARQKPVAEAQAKPKAKRKAKLKAKARTAKQQKKKAKRRS
jgi:Rps23 Pro-64 3,4-dihydroxylase Tpa1-like proline 4-hydroxylase